MWKRKSRGFNYEDIIFIIILAFLSFEMHNFRIARPQNPISSELFELRQQESYLNTEIVSGEEKALGRLLKHYFIFLNEINITELVSKDNNTEKIYYSSYRYISLRQFSSFSALLCPVAFFVFLILIGTNRYTAKCCSIILIFCKIEVYTCRYFGSHGLFHLMFILSLIFIFQFSFYKRNSLNFYIITLFGGVTLMLCTSVHVKSFAIYAFFAAFYFALSESLRLKDCVINFLLLSIPTLISEIAAPIIEKSFMNNGINTIKYKKMESFNYSIRDLPSSLIIVIAVVLSYYYYIKFKRKIDLRCLPFTLNIVMFTSISSLFGYMQIYKETSIAIISSLIIFAILTTNYTVMNVKYFSCILTLFVLLSVVYFIYNAPFIYNYDSPKL